MPDLDDDPTTDVTGRRRFMRRSVIGGAALVAGGAAAGAGAAAAATGNDADRSADLVVECAVLGDAIRVLPTFVLLADAGLDEGDMRGSTFWTEGYLYPEGTIAGDGFVPTEEGRIGTFICRGHFLLHPGRVEPHLVTHQEYYFGELELPVGRDMLGSQGIEGGNSPAWEAMRMVTGGTGAYRGARGQVLQRMISVNTTLDEFGNPAPNFRFEFDIDLP